MPLTIKVSPFLPDRASWTDFVVHHPNGNIFQTPEIFDLFLTVKNYTPVLVIAMDDQAIKGILVSVTQKEHSGFLGRFSSRTIVWGGPLVDLCDPNPYNIALLLINNLIEVVKRRSVYMEFRNLFDVSSLKLIFQKTGFLLQNYTNFIVNTQVEANPIGKISKSKIRQVKKSLRNGAELIIPDNINQVKEFYNILKDIYRNKIKKPLPDWSLFENFFYQSSKSKMGIYLLIKFDGKIVGGIMCPIFHSKFIYEWYVCGLDDSFSEIHPSILATYSSIEYAFNNGIEQFDFMGAGKSENDYGVREFKSKFGGDQVHYGRYLKVNRKTLFVIGSYAIRVKRFLSNYLKT